MNSIPWKSNRTLRPGVWDAVVAGVVLILAGILALLLFKSGGDALYCKVIQNGAVVEKVALEEGIIRRIELDGEYPCVVMVEGGAAAFVESTCPNGDCVRSGSISEAGQSAACLPNRAVILIEGEKDTVVDAVTG